jgi:hypothetical protein
MTIILTYAEVTAVIIGLSLILITFLFCVRLITKTAGKLKKTIIYFLISSIPGGVYIGGRLFNFETLLPEGKLINLILIALVFFFTLMGTIELNKIVNELIENKAGCKIETKSKKEMKVENNQQEKRPIITFGGSLGNKYLDLTGRKPKFRE